MNPQNSNANQEGSNKSPNAKNRDSETGLNQPSSTLLLNAIPQQIWTADTSGEINYVNDTVCRDFGQSRETVLAYGWTAFVHKDDLATSINSWKASLESGKEYTNEFRLLFSDGNYYWHLAIARLVRQEGKSDIWVGTNTNIHLQKTSEARKDEFISIASHELKTPLTTSKGFHQLLLRMVGEGKIKTYLERSAGQLTRLEKLIADLLDVSKINAGKMIFDSKTFNFSAMLTDVVAEMRQIYPSHQLLLVAENNISFTGDQFRLEQVVHNFISNAVKYSPDAKTVEISARIIDENIIVSVKDYGIGIKSKHLKQLFERYYRADNSSTRFNGLGLGLYISADIIKRHGGSFWIESSFGNGATFSFKLPLISSGSADPDIRTKSYYRDKHLSITCPVGSDIMYVEWTGYQDMNTVKRGGSLMIEYLKENRRSKVFNDNRLVPGTWSEASDWAANIWLPLMELAGLKFFAWILSESAFSQLSAQKSVENEEKHSEIVFFTQAEEGLKWLEEKSTFQPDVDI
ncbi:MULTISPECIES: PAS domain-containing sensor histidine kinase [unclassified Pedobacter]|uniref:sensor histidine kinase n=1 Tax=unclassified Pedobacter TaxID=2628915 RepID=UPI001D4F8384|nr:MULTISPECIES: PAS domain-containing sensor histidine kinase [unclassified Pedobacter]CAH0309047.1 Sensor histidine kinase WalK [Pedobacter sp. Bi36]CAH0315584.1 Sensor histidine kinase WalK [Pedobacter sp. Bi126]